MRVIHSSDVNVAYLDTLFLFSESGSVTSIDTRNGRALRCNVPVTIVHTRPRCRVLFDEQRDANPFFHLFESMWMLAGRNDVSLPAMFAKQINAYSDDGLTLNGAYGWRWRNHFNHDQLLWVVSHLMANPDSRRAVIQMYDAELDHKQTDAKGKDIPCNTQVFFSRSTRGQLDMMVTNRSNDAIWGALGANVVHFSFLHEFVAQALQWPIGVYYQVSNDFHLYEQHWPLVATRKSYPDVHYHRSLTSIDLVNNDYIDFLDAIEEWCVNPTNYDETGFRFIDLALRPMHAAWSAHKRGDTVQAIEEVKKVGALDWSLAGHAWLVRRVK